MNNAMSGRRLFASFLFHAAALFFALALLDGVAMAQREATRPAPKNAEQFYAQVAITAQDIAEIIAFAVTRPHRVALNEILIRPTAQP